MFKVTLKNRIQIEKMRVAGKLAAEVLDFITPHVQPGVSTEELNTLCHDFIIRHKAIPAPLNYRGFPKSICTSRNNVVCHGIPRSDEILQDGDILNIDVTVIVDGWHGDTSRMFEVGRVSPARAKLVRDTHTAMMLGIQQVRSGAWLSEIGRAIDAFSKERGYGVVRDYCGHGIDQIFHEDPVVLHYDHGDKTYDMRLKKGMVFTVEPMLNAGGDWQTRLQPDEWTVLTTDGSDSAQFEHTIAVTDDGFDILTASPKGWQYPPYNG